MFLHIFVQLLNLVILNALKFENVTYEVFPVNSAGIIAAFGHFNSDEFTDIFSIQQGSKKLQIFMGSENGQSFHSYVNCSLDSFITSVVPGDFNGDSFIDILITLIDPDSDDQYVKILWGGVGFLDCKSPNMFKIRNQPLIVDFNGDMIPDIIGEIKLDGKYERYLWMSSRDKIFSNQSLANISNQKFQTPHSSGLIDLNNDLMADILITGDKNIEVWLSNGKKFAKNYTIPYPQKISKNFQSTFVDLNLDGKIDIILPVCYDDSCTSSSILVWNPYMNESKWEVLLDNFKHENSTWGFKLPAVSPPDLVTSSVTLRTGDIDMDGFPDLLTILQSKSNWKLTKPVIIKNTPCNNGSQFMPGRCLEIIWDIPGLQDIPDVEIVAFFDMYEDGILDILASTKNNNEWKIHALKNVEILDSCFMKVLVLSGLCNNCSSMQMPYGVNFPGPIVQYNMTKSDGHPLGSRAVQISQTAYFPLHLPYSLFGLGQTPNFIDALTVAIPAKFDETVHKREWTQIIPNSQIVVIPHPPTDERRWVKKLFVTPSHYVFLTCIALIGTCIFIAILVALLHWKERKEDKKEKMQDAYRFHFDAM